LPKNTTKHGKATNQTMANMSWEPTNHSTTTTNKVASECTSPSSKAFVDSFVNELSFGGGPVMSEAQLLQEGQNQSETLRRSFSSSSDTVASSSSSSSKGRRSSRRNRDRSNPNISNNRSPGGEESVPQEPLNWKTAVDPVSGRTYFYDTVTRKTQWEKVRTLSIIECFDFTSARRPLVYRALWGGLSCRFGEPLSPHCHSFGTLYFRPNSFFLTHCVLSSFFSVSLACFTLIHMIKPIFYSLWKCALGKSS
jgi:hypothetical protein